MSEEKVTGPSVAVLGGGILGLSAAFYCLRQRLGHVVVYEADEELGGLAGTFDVCGTKLEKYHHFICHGDKVILKEMAEAVEQGCAARPSEQEQAKAAGKRASSRGAAMARADGSDNPALTGQGSTSDVPQVPAEG